MPFVSSSFPVLCAGAAVYVAYPPLKKMSAAGTLALRCLFNNSPVLYEKKNQAFEELKIELKNNGLKNLTITALLISSFVVIYKNNLNEEKIEELLNQSNEEEKINEIKILVIDGVNKKLNEIDNQLAAALNKLKAREEYFEDLLYFKEQERWTANIVQIFTNVLSSTAAVVSHIFLQAYKVRLAKPLFTMAKQ